MEAEFFLPMKKSKVNDFKNKKFSSEKGKKLIIPSNGGLWQLFKSSLFFVFKFPLYVSEFCFQNA